MITSAEIIQFIAQESGVEARKISPYSDLEKVLRISGDDASELMTKIAEKYKVDFEEFVFLRHFSTESSMLHPVFYMFFGIILCVGGVAKVQTNMVSAIFLMIFGVGMLLCVPYVRRLYLEYKEFASLTRIPITPTLLVNVINKGKWSKEIYD